MARWRGGAEGVAAVISLGNIREGLQSYHNQIRLSTCELLGELLGYKYKKTVQAVVTIVPREDIVALLRYV
jgi:hypothetical protein